MDNQETGPGMIIFLGSTLQGRRYGFARPVKPRQQRWVFDKAVSRALLRFQEDELPSSFGWDQLHLGAVVAHERVGPKRTLLRRGGMKYAGSVRGLVRRGRIQTWDPRHGVGHVLLIGAPPWFRNAQFRPGEIVALPILIDKLQSNQDPVSQFILENLSPGTIELMRAFVNNSSQEQALHMAITSDLNRIMKMDDFYTKDRFRHLNLSEQCRSYLSRPRGEQRPNVRGRFLLDDAFPLELGRNPIFFHSYFADNFQPLSPGDFVSLRLCRTYSRIHAYDIYPCEEPVPVLKVAQASANFNPSVEATIQDPVTQIVPPFQLDPSEPAIVSKKTGFRLQLPFCYSKPLEFMLNKRLGEGKKRQSFASYGILAAAYRKGRILDGKASQQDEKHHGDSDSKKTAQAFSRDFRRWLRDHQIDEDGIIRPNRPNGYTIGSNWDSRKPLLGTTSVQGGVTPRIEFFPAENNPEEGENAEHEDGPLDREAD